jgi:hypothetical protein
VHRPADENQHDQAHAFLSIVGAVEEAYQRAGEDKDPANPPWRGMIAYRFGIQRGNADDGLEEQQQGSSKSKAEQRRQ